jgi:hypothetical protein
VIEVAGASAGEPDLTCITGRQKYSRWLVNVYPMVRASGCRLVSHFMGTSLIDWWPTWWPFGGQADAVELATMMSNWLSRHMVVFTQGGDLHFFITPPFCPLNDPTGLTALKLPPPNEREGTICLLFPQGFIA